MQMLFPQFTMHCAKIVDLMLMELGGGIPAENFGAGYKLEVMPGRLYC
jgi:hypothetical protein